MTNTLAYYGTESITAIKMLMRQERFFIVSHLRTSLIYQASLEPTLVDLFECSKVIALKNTLAYYDAKLITAEFFNDIRVIISHLCRSLICASKYRAYPCKATYSEP